jgi:hypothetical protein
MASNPMNEHPVKMWWQQDYSIIRPDSAPPGGAALAQKQEQQIKVWTASPLTDVRSLCEELSRCWGPPNKQSFMVRCSNGAA